MDSELLLYYDSRDKKYKKPFGAVALRSRITLRLSVSRRMAPLKVELLLRHDGEKEARALPLLWERREEARDLYRVKFSLSKPGLYHYVFRVTTQVSEPYYGAREEYRGGEGVLTYDTYRPFSFTVYDKDARVPGWFGDGITYQIFPDRFAISGGRKALPGRRLVPDLHERPYKTVLPGGDVPNDYFYGGNLRGVAEKLPYLASLGVKTLYLNPIFSSHSNHRYDTADYMKIDPMLGEEEDFVFLCRKAEEAGMRVMLDGVFNHTGSDSVYFNKEGRYPGPGAYQGKSSPYYDWYEFRSFPDDYACWWDVKILPAVNENAPSFRRFITGKDGVVRKWLRLGASAWRLDVADELPDDFIREIKKAALEEKKDAFILGEVWEDASVKIAYGQRRTYLLGDELDGVMNYPFRDAVLAYLLKKDAEAFRNILLGISENYPFRAERSLMNLLGTHDTPRILSVLGGAEELAPKDLRKRAEYRLPPERLELAKKRLKLASLLLFTHLGSPTVYYGDEAGTEGLEDPANRSFFLPEESDAEILDWYRLLAKIREKEKVFSASRPGYREARGARLSLSWRRGVGLFMNAGEEIELFRLPFRARDLLTGKVFSEGEIPVPPLGALLYKREEEGENDG